MKQRKRRVWQMWLILALLFTLFVIVVDRVERETSLMPVETMETVKPEEIALQIHSPVPETPAPWTVAATARESKVPAATNDPEIPAATNDPEIPAATDEPELIAGRVMSDATPVLLEIVPLAKETQWAIYALCEDDTSLFCALMAIARVESCFDPSAVGDDGSSVGLMQINYSLHTARIERLGVTDLYDPVQSATVAADYIKELAREFNVGTGDHVLYMAYNRGPTGAREQFSQGVYSNAYSWAVMGYYDVYLEAMMTGA